MDQEIFTDMVFPYAGTDVTTEYELQRQGTTPLGTNVRAFESLTSRGRGGSRPGLTKLLDATVT